MSKGRCEDFTSKCRDIFTISSEFMTGQSDPAFPSASPKAMASDAFQSKVVCTKCGEDIVDRYLLKVNGLCWHVRCLSCSVCQTSLCGQTTCYAREQEVFCKLDYVRKYPTRCSCCGELVHSSDWVHRAKANVYHLACFSCVSCKRLLSTGEEFTLVGQKLFCLIHYDSMLDKLKEKGKSVCTAELSTGCEINHKPSKRARTSFTADQLQLMQAQFTQDNNPDAQTLQKLAEQTRLSRRVIQVWFQNCRARQKKHISPPRPAGLSSVCSQSSLNELHYPETPLITGLQSFCIDAHTSSSLFYQPLCYQSTQLPISSS